MPDSSAFRDVGRARRGPVSERVDICLMGSVTEDRPLLFRSCRHTGIPRLANHPAIPLVHVRDFARHSDLATTQGYSIHKIEDHAVTVAIAEALVGAKEES
jgi:hypothetical protein